MWAARDYIDSLTQSNDLLSVAGDNEALPQLAYQQNGI
jgi:hypothetical protein